MVWSFHLEGENLVVCTDGAHVEEKDLDKVKQSIEDLTRAVDVLKDVIAGLTTSLTVTTTSV